MSTPNSTEVSASPSPAPSSVGNNAPKFGTLVPNRVFVGGISAATTEEDLMELFSNYGKVKATKVIGDRAGVSKGYGFVTFETEEEARRLMEEADNITFRDRKLNIAPAIKKQLNDPSYMKVYAPHLVDPTTPGVGNGAAMFFANNGAATYSPYATSMPLLSQGSHEYPLSYPAAQAATANASQYHPSLLYSQPLYFPPYGNQQFQYPQMVQWPSASPTTPQWRWITPSAYAQPCNPSQCDLMDTSSMTCTTSSPQILAPPSSQSFSSLIATNLPFTSPLLTMATASATASDATLNSTVTSDPTLSDTSYTMDGNNNQAEGSMAAGTNIGTNEAAKYHHIFSAPDIPPLVVGEGGLNSASLNINKYPILASSKGLPEQQKLAKGSSAIWESAPMYMAMPLPTEAVNSTMGPPWCPPQVPIFYPHFGRDRTPPQYSYQTLPAQQQMWTTNFQPLAAPTPVHPPVLPVAEVTYNPTQPAARRLIYSSESSPIMSSTITASSAPLSDGMSPFLNPWVNVYYPNQTQNYKGQSVGYVPLNSPYMMPCYPPYYQLSLNPTSPLATPLFSPKTPKCQPLISNHQLNYSDPVAPCGSSSPRSTTTTTHVGGRFVALTTAAANGDNSNGSKPPSVKLCWSSTSEQPVSVSRSSVMGSPKQVGSVVPYYRSYWTPGQYSPKLGLPMTPPSTPLLVYPNPPSSQS